MGKARFAALGIVAFAALTAASPLNADDDFPIAGTYTENTPCPGAGADAVRVKITERDIDSPILGLCTILDKKRDGGRFFLHVECKDPGGAPLLGDINFTMKGDNSLDFSDQDNTYKAVLHKCP